MSFRLFLPDAFLVLEDAKPLETSWYFGAVCEHAQALLTGELTRLVVTQPPGTLKSITWCAAFPAWVWTRYAIAKFLFATNEQRNAKRDANFTRKLIQSDWYRRTFTPDWRISDTQDEKLYYETTRGGHRLGLTTGGSSAGKKGHFLFVDDLHDAAKVYSKTVRESEKDWFRMGFSDRMVNFKTSVLAAIGHRVHKEDLSGELIAEGWSHLNLPEEWSEKWRKTWPVQVEQDGRRLRSDPRTTEGEWLRPGRFSEREKANAKQTGGSNVYEAKHNQNPTNRAGAMFDFDKPKRVTAYPVGTVAVRYWDTAASEDEAACNTSGTLIGRTPEGRFIVMNEERGKWNPTTRNRIMRNRGLSDMKLPGLSFRRLYWEKGTSDSGLERDLILARALAGIPCAADPARGSKVQRAEGLAAQWDAGNVDILDDGTWDVHGYLTRMSEFPTSGDKDTTDSSSGGFNRLVLGTTDPDLYGTGEAADTITGQLPPGTFDPNPPSDPYA